MRVITLQEFADNYKEPITCDLQDVIGNLQGVASEAAPELQADLNQQIAKLESALQILCDVPPPCTDSSR